MLKSTMLARTRAGAMVPILLVAMAACTADGAGPGGDAGTAATDHSACTANCNGMEASSRDSSGSEGVDAAPCTAPVFANPSGAAAGAWVNRTQGTDASGKIWTAVASDAPGDKLVAGSRFVIPPGCLAGDLWTSTNVGMAWTPWAAGPEEDWASVASDSSGTNLVAVANGGGIWTSNNSGVTWTDRTPSGSAGSQGWSSVASDSTGSHLVAVVGGGDIWTSNGSGVTWTDQTPSGSAHGQSWASVASDSTGTHLVAVAVHPGSLGGCDILSPASAGYAGGSIWTSTDGGATWTDQTPSGTAMDLCWASVASDSSGTNLIAVGSGIWTSANAGVTWTQQTAPPTTNWISVASDATGTHVVAINRDVFSSNGDIWASTDSGVTWTNQTSGTFAAHQAWSAVASDSTGAHLVAVVSGGDIWTN